MIIKLTTPYTCKAVKVNFDVEKETNYTDFHDKYPDMEKDLFLGQVCVRLAQMLGKRMEYPIDQITIEHMMMEHDGLRFQGGVRGKYPKWEVYYERQVA